MNKKGLVEAPTRNTNNNNNNNELSHLLFIVVVRSFALNFEKLLTTTNRNRKFYGTLVVVFT